MDTTKNVPDLNTNDDLDTIMAAYEAQYDKTLPYDGYVIARLDGNGFSKMTKKNGFKKPFDERFHNCMVYTAKACMDAGFRMIYGYTTSDEITLLLHPNDDSYNHRIEKICSLLAGAASSAFTLASGILARFDCRVRVYSKEDAAKCFLWRQRSGFRNAVNGYAYWLLIEKEHLSGRAATSHQRNLSIKDSIALIESYGLTLTSIPAWQLYGSTFYKIEKTVSGLNPVTKQPEDAIRHQLICNDNPLRESKLVNDIYRRITIAEEDSTNDNI